MGPNALAHSSFVLSLSRNDAVAESATAGTVTDFVAERGIYAASRSEPNGAGRKISTLLANTR